MKKFLALLLALLMIFSMTACGSTDEDTDANEQTDGTAVDWENSDRIKEIKEAGKIVMGTSADYAPFEFHTMIDGEDVIVGFDIMIAEKFADFLGVELEVVDMSFNSLLIGLSNGEFDFVMASLAPDAERDKAADFTEAYFDGEQVVLLRAEDADKYKTTEDLKGKTVAAQQASIQVPLAIDAAGEENVVQLVKAGDMVNELIAGKVEAVFLDSVIAAGYAAVNEDLVMADIGIVYDSPGSVVACQEGDADLVACLNEAIAALSEEEKNEMLIEAQKLAGITEE